MVNGLEKLLTTKNNRMFNPSVKNLFTNIWSTKPFAKITSVFFILFQYFALFCGGEFFIIITSFLILSTILILAIGIDENSVIENFWIFFVLGPGLVAFLIVVIIELVNIFNYKKEK
jgi:hypothetical protein